MTKPFDPNAELFNVEVKVPHDGGEMKWIVLFDSIPKEDAEEKATFMKRGQPSSDSVRVRPRFHP